MGDRQLLDQVYALGYEFEQKYEICPQCVLAALQETLGGIDEEVFTSGLLEAEALGRYFLCRTAASFVQVRAGLTARPLLQPADFDRARSTGGLILVGSYVPRATSQVEALARQLPDTSFEVGVDGLLDERRPGCADLHEPPGGRRSRCCRQPVHRAAHLGWPGYPGAVARNPAALPGGERWHHLQ